MNKNESIQRYLARGGKIHKIPTGLSGETKKSYRQVSETLKQMNKHRVRREK